MFGAGPTTGTLRALRPLSLHGIEYFDVAVQMDDGRVESARLGPEGLDRGLEPGDRVRIERIGMVVVGISRAEPEGPQPD